MTSNPDTVKYQPNTWPQGGQTKSSDVAAITVEQAKYWMVDLTSDHYVSNISMSRVEAETAADAEREALKRMAEPHIWRVIGTDRC